MKKIEIEEQEEGQILRLRIREGKEIVTVRYIRKDMFDLLISKVKKEVFDDIDKQRFIVWDKKSLRIYNEVKKRHLSTFQKKSDIITVLEKKK